MTYQDRTFCNSKCASESCDRKFTDRVRLGAAVWWKGPNAPIAVSDFQCSSFLPIVEEQRDVCGNLHSMDGPALVWKEGGILKTRWVIDGVDMSFSMWCINTQATKPEKALMLLKYE